MSRYWVFHDRRLKGPLDPEGLRALEGFSLDMRVCPEGGPETDWRPAREHGELVALARPAEPSRAATAEAPLPAIPRLTPLPPAAAAPIPAPLPPDPRVDELMMRVAALEKGLGELWALAEDLRSGRDGADRRVDELASAVASAFEKISELKQAPPPAPAPEPVPEPEPVAPPPFAAAEPAPETKPEEPAFVVPPPFSELAHAEEPQSESILPPPPAVEPPALPDFAPLASPPVFETPPEDRTMILPPPPAVEPPALPEIAPLSAPPVFETPPEDRTMILPPAPPPVETPPEDRTQVLQVPVAGQAPKTGFRKLRILNADDDELMRQAIASTFRGAGHDVDSVEDGKQALEKVSMNPYDLLILDEGMPGGSGFQVARAVSKVDADSRPKVIIFTASFVGNKLARETFLMSGADEVLSKEAGMNGLLKKACELTGLPLPD